jgi:hypothetical protein
MHVGVSLPTCLTWLHPLLQEWRAEEIRASYADQRKRKAQVDGLLKYLLAKGRTPTQA